MAPVASAAAAAPDVVVLELGTNDADPASFRAAADSMSAALADVLLVLWVVPRSPKVSAAAIAVAIRDVASTHAHATTADWSAEAPADAFSEDGVHLLPDRQDVFASFVAERLSAWARATRGQGAASCVASVGEALSRPG
jgi:lysophospholipase L1-like esterase